jgi:hypothetical protein
MRPRCEQECEHVARERLASSSKTPARKRPRGRVASASRRGRKSFRICVDILQHAANFMPTGGRHPDKDVRKAVADAEDAGWQVKKGRNHRWGTLTCPCGSHSVAVNSTPRDAGTHAKRIREAIVKCPLSSP